MLPVCALAQNAQHQRVEDGMHLVFSGAALGLVVALTAWLLGGNISLLDAALLYWTVGFSVPALAFLFELLAPTPVPAPHRHRR